MSNSSNVQVRQASSEDLEALIPLFDGYRQFSGKPSDTALARSFLIERFQLNQSATFIAMQSDDSAVGFTQFYPTFSSVSATHTFIPNDLFVASVARCRGVIIKLIAAAAEFGRSAGAVRLSLSTAMANVSARALYSAQGWVRDTDFYAYRLSL